MNLGQNETIWCMREKELDLFLQQQSAQVKNEDPIDDMAKMPRPYMMVNGNIAVVQVSGPLIPRGNSATARWGVIGYNQVRDAIEFALQDPSVKGVMVKVFSGGGSWTCQTPLFDWLMGVRGIKPMACYVDEYACSAAMGLAMHLPVIGASRSSRLGSLSTLASHEYYVNDKVVVTRVRAGSRKALIQEDEPLSDEAKEKLVSDVNEINQMFLANVSRARPRVSVELIESLQGDDFGAQKALELGFIDKICSFEEMLGQMKEMVIMDELLKALGAQNESEAVMAVNNFRKLENSIGFTGDKAVGRVSELAAAEKALEKQNAALNVLYTQLGVSNIEQAVAAAQGLKLTENQLKAQGERLKVLESERVKNGVEALVAKNQNKMTPDLRALVDDAVELAQAAGRDPIAQVAVLLDRSPVLKDVTNYTAPVKQESSGAASPAAKASALTDEQRKYIQQKAPWLSDAEALEIFAR